MDRGCKRETRVTLSVTILLWHGDARSFAATSCCPRASLLASRHRWWRRGCLAREAAARGRLVRARLEGRVVVVARGGAQRAVDARPELLVLLLHLRNLRRDRRWVDGRVLARVFLKIKN